MVQWLCWNRFRGKLIKHLCKYCKDVFLQTEWKSFYFVGKWSSLFYSLFSYHSCKIGKEKRISRSFFWLMSAIVVMMEDKKNTHPVMSHLEGPCTPVTYIHQINTIALVYISPGLFLEILQVLCYTSHGNYLEQNNKDLSYLQASGSFIIFGIIFYWLYSFLISASWGRVLGASYTCLL